MNKVKLQTHAAANSAEYKAGLPGAWPRFSIPVDDDYQLSADDIVQGFVLSTVADVTAVMEDLHAVVATWYDEQATAAVSVDERLDTYLITRQEFLSRLSDVELLTIQQLATTNPQVSRLWATFNALTEGIAGPPDGTTPERALAQAAFGLCVQLFGQERAAVLFAKP